MGTFLAVFGLAVFLFGLVQWARGGAALWSLLRLKRKARSADSAERTREDAELRRAERATDHFLRSSFRVIGILAIVMWLFLGATVVLDLLGIDWMDRISSRARTFWGSPVYNRAPVTTTHAPTKRNNILKSLGEKLRK